MYLKKYSVARKESGVLPPLRKESGLSMEPISRKQSRMVGDEIPRGVSEVMRKCSAPLLGCRCLGPCRLKALQLDCGMNLLMMSSSVGGRKMSRAFVHVSFRLV